MYETQVHSLGQEDPLEKELATHSSILAWRITWTEEPSELESMESQRVGHDWATNTHPHPSGLGTSTKSFFFQVDLWVESGLTRDLQVTER